MPWLKGKRILVVEDEALIAVMVEDMLADLGSLVVGPAATIEAALELARREAIDAAILDVNVRGDILLGKIKASTARPSFDRDVLIQLRKASPVPRPPQEVLSSGSISLDFPIKFELTR